MTTVDDDTLLSGWTQRLAKGQEDQDEGFSELHIPEIDNPAQPRGTSKTEAKRLKDIEERRSQGDRTDWHQMLRQGTPPGYALPGGKPLRPIPIKTLSLSQKQAIARSFKAGADRRQVRRETTGVPVQYDNIAYKRLGVAGREAFDATKRTLGLKTCPETGKRWDWYADFHWHGYVEAHVDHLFRSGSANPQGKQAWVRYHREGTPQ